jgi:hypothetical protein
MKIKNRHERIVMAPPERIAPLIGDFDLTWPAESGAAPRLVGDRLYDTGLMLWEELQFIPGGKSAPRLASRPGLFPETT